MQIDVSVVIPTLGRPCLKRALDSATAQTVAPREVVVVHNGPDNERGLPQHDRVEVPLRRFDLPSRSGPSVARNVGAWHAVGRYVAFLDDDDAYDPGYLAAMWQHRNDAELLYGRKVFVNAHGEVEREKRISSIRPDRVLQALYTGSNPGFGGTNLFVARSVFFEVGGFPAYITTSEDRALAIAALRAGRTVAHVEGAVVRCHTPEGYRAKLDPEKVRAQRLIVRDNWDDLSWASRYVVAKKALRRWLRSRR